MEPHVVKEEPNIPPKKAKETRPSKLAEKQVASGTELMEKENNKPITSKEELVSCSSNSLNDVSNEGSTSLMHPNTGAIKKKKPTSHALVEPNTGAIKKMIRTPHALVERKADSVIPTKKLQTDTLCNEISEGGSTLSLEELQLEIPFIEHNGKTVFPKHKKPVCHSLIESKEGTTSDLSLEKPQSSSKSLNASKGVSGISKEKENKQKEETPKENRGQLTVDQLKIEIIPTVHDILRCIKNDPIGRRGRHEASQEIQNKIDELQECFNSAREQINQLTGLDSSKEAQQAEFDLLKQKLVLQKQLLAKYRPKKF